MSDALERDTVIELLDKLGSEQDEDALAAARTLHAQITDAGAKWEDLLVGEDVTPPEPPPEEEYDDDDEEEEDDGDGEEDAPSDEPAISFTGDEAETQVLINKLLAREGNSDAFREELEEYQTDLANGSLEPDDHRYIHALYARLSKTN